MSEAAYLAQRFLETLHKIAEEYESPEELAHSAEQKYGLCYREVLEMAYENIQQEARDVIRGIRFINPICGEANCTGDHK